MPELHVNIDHIATVRQARKTFEPSILAAVKILEKTSSSGITMHLREDRRHVQDQDMLDVDRYLHETNSKLTLTFEMAASLEIRSICLKTKSKLATLVPEKRQELTTEGGMDLLGQHESGSSTKNYLSEFIKPIKDNAIAISLFIDPDLKQVELAKEIGAEFIELHTGSYANLFIEDLNKIYTSNEFKLDPYHNYSKQISDRTKKELERIKQAVAHAQSIGLRTNLGHGLTVDNLAPILEIPGIEELHIGHSLVANSLFMGLEESANRFLRALN